ncbi:arginyltransferase [Cavenderia fasciculata]|uniref:Arginyl-tRNA--protein transferase 1 n=1 Tax=Cavenderia fasciculata TaxID=261658 RepID=F4Q001_CACFS|nr:arginyltransferase [Cavenderia fasciculata]EGG18915.1 arginyltransferase [Cavenderia fasciculata]|eukprot:XP_004357377.1 arginyltransferase [Cavenderia fasciculata]
MNISNEIKNKSQVYPYGYNGGECHYCYETEDGRNSYGMDAKQLTVDDYQSLCDTGWRRSGSYVYKPDNANVKSCCPQYTIRLDVLRFTMTKDNKNTVKKFDRYLETGSTTVDKLEREQLAQEKSKKKLLHQQELKEKQQDPNILKIQHWILLSIKQLINNNKGVDIDDELLKPCIILKENPKKLQQSRGLYSFDLARIIKIDQLQQIEDFGNKLIITLQSTVIENQTFKVQENITKNHINFNPINNINNTITTTRPIKIKVDNNNNNESKIKIEPSHNLTITLHKPECTDEIFKLYTKYQTIVHKEKGEKKKDSFTRFLVDSPLIYVPYSTEGYYSRGEKISIPKCGFGSFHQHYRIDGQLIAVGIVDILPHCLSSVYFIYDPDYSFVSIGKYSAIKEIEQTKRLALEAPQLHYYYMGYYIHSCPKMKYKANYKPSELLCPEVYRWVDVTKAVERIEKSKYSPLAVDERMEPLSKRSPFIIDNVKFMSGNRVFGLQDIKQEYQKKYKTYLSDFVDNVGEHLLNNLILKLD